MDIMKHFPFPEFRQHQKEVLEQCGEILENKNYLLINAPVGAGKSPLGLSIARAFNKAHMITTQKSLQEQYVKDFRQDIYVMKGKGNYPCITEPGVMCNAGPCRKNKEIGCYQDKWFSCTFYQALMKAQNHPIVLHNFSSFLYQVNLAYYFTNRDVMIIDEAHNIERQLMDYVSFKISSNTIGYFLPKKKTIEEYIEVIKTIQAELTEKYNKMANDPYIKDEKIEELERVIGKISFFLLQVDQDPLNWVFNTELDNLGHVAYIEVKPVFIRAYAHSFLFQYAGKVICMSATVERQSFCSSLGIDENDCGYIEIPSTFPIKNRPIIKDYVGGLNRKTLVSKLPDIAEKVREYLAMYPDKKGLIHTQTFQIAKYIKENVRDDRLIFHGMDTMISRDEALANHSLLSYPTVIVSPSMCEGLDLKEDLGRWQVIIKVPYPYLGDAQIKARTDRDYRWYVYETIKTICQASGRIVRSEKDTGHTYILDMTFDKLLRNHKKLFPVWFIEAITEREREEVIW